MNEFEKGRNTTELSPGEEVVLKPCFGFTGFAERNHTYKAVTQADLNSSLGFFVSIEEAQNHFQDHKVSESLSHTLCPSCYDLHLREIKGYKEKT